LTGFPAVARPLLRADLISASLIICGIMTAIQVTGVRLPLNRQWGAGILSVMGISFTTFAPANSTIAGRRRLSTWLASREFGKRKLTPGLVAAHALSCTQHLVAGQLRSLTRLASPLSPRFPAALMAKGDSFNEAFGKVLGTAAICALVPLLISFLPHRAIKKVCQ
jgi:hypothetical protein